MAYSVTPGFGIKGTGSLKFAFGGSLGSGSVTLLVLLARAAGAGLIASDLGTGPDWFGGLGLRRAGLELEILLLPSLALLDLLGLVLRFGRLH
jgi:hypothetical protein